MRSFLNGIVLTLFLSSFCFAQWKYIYPWPCGSGIVSQCSFGSDVWFLSETGDVLKSTDYGISWSYQDTKGVPEMRNIFFINSDTGWIGNKYGAILKTSNGGELWEVYSAVVPYEITDLFFTDALNGWITTFQGVYKSADGGITWSFVSNLPASTFNSIRFIGSNGYIGGWNGKVYKSTDNGQNWSDVSTDGDFRIEQLFFTSPDTGWICGARVNLDFDRSISKTTDGGNSWIVQMNHINQGDGLILAVCMRNDTGFAASSGGEIYASVNAGDNWDVIYQSPLAFGLTIRI